MHEQKKPTGSTFKRKNPLKMRKICEHQEVWNEIVIWVFPANRGGPTKSSILIGFSIINHPFWRTSIFGNTLHLMFDFSCLGFSNGPFPHPKTKSGAFGRVDHVERLQSAVHVEVSVDGPLLVATSCFSYFGRFIRNKKEESNWVFVCFCMFCL